MSVELAKEGFGGLDDHFGHFDVGPIDHGGRAVSDQAAELMQLQLPLAKQSFEHGHDVNDQCRFLFAQHDDTIVGRHDVRDLMEAGGPLAEGSSAGVRSVARRGRRPRMMNSSLDTATEGSRRTVMSRFAWSPVSSSSHSASL